MRIPHIISPNALIAYEASQITKELLLEVGRVLVSEEMERTDAPPPNLVSLCVICIAKNFEKYPIIEDLILCSDRDFLLEILPVDLPLPLVIPIIDDEVYWKRRYTLKYGVLSQHVHEGWTWKCIVLENHMQELIEQAQPQYNDEENMEDVTTLLNPFVHSLKIDQLQCWIPPLTMDKEDIPEIYPSDHINLEPIFNRLVSIEELEIRYGVNKVAESFKWNMFIVTIDDCKRLGKALLHLERLRVFRLHNSNIEDNHVRILTKELIKIASLESLEISYCRVGDQGALCIAKLMMSHSNLKRLDLTNNLIGGIGGEGIGYALMQDSCCPLEYLNLRLNPLGHTGLMGLFRALVRVVDKVKELIISGCGFEDETSIRLGAVLQLHRALVSLDVTNNWLYPGQQQILNGILINTSLHKFDMRETNIDDNIKTKINRKLQRNIKGQTYDIVEDEEEEISEELEGEGTEVPGTKTTGSEGEASGEETDAIPEEGNEDPQ